MVTFDGFRPELFSFLAELTMNNNRDWWAVNKDRYEEQVRGPALAFIEAMEPCLADISPRLLAVAKKSGGSMMRPFRDTRFSADKTPYKTNVGIQFRHERGKDVHAPGLYLHLSMDEVFIGAGMWRPESSALAGVRQRIIDEPDAWLAVRDDPRFAELYRLGGESLKRPPRGFPKEHALIEDLKRKDHIAVLDLTEDDVVDDGFLDRIADLFGAATPYMRFLTEAVGLPF
jgi:uncharacterized protein (TIGR02453 family)